MTRSWWHQPLNDYRIELNGHRIRPLTFPPTLALLGVHPNPARTSITLSYSIPGNSTAELELLDVAGRAVQRLDLGAPGPGRHQTQWARPAALAALLFGSLPIDQGFTLRGIRICATGGSEIA